MNYTHLRITIDNKTRLIPLDKVKSIDVAMGDMIQYYDWCGSSITGFQCKECREKSTKDNQVYCHKRRVAFETRGSPEALIITLCNREEIIVDKYEYV